MILFVLFNPLKASQKGLQKLDPDYILDGKDFDMDNEYHGRSTDLTDPCPCGRSETIEEVGSTKYCIVDEWKEKQCKAADEYINTYSKAKDAKEIKKFFWDKTQDNKHVCLYLVDWCYELINLNPNWNINYSQQEIGNSN